MTDQELLALYEHRDPEAVSTMEQQYGPYCIGIINRILSDSRDQEECLNDVRLRVWRALEHQRPSNLKGWLGAIARNCAITRCRQIGMLPLSLEDSAAELAIPLSNTPAEQLDSQVLGTVISDFLKTLPDTTRIVFVRRYWYGDTVQQAANHVGWSVSKTKTSLYRTRMKLKDHLSKEGFYHG